MEDCSPISLKNSFENTIGKASLKKELNHLNN